MLAGFWQVAAVVDSQAAQAAGVSPHGAPSELVVKNPVPGVVGRLFQLAFNLPSWFQWAGAIVGMLVAAFLAFKVYQRRAEVFAWFGAQSTGYKMGLAAVAAVALIGAGGVGYAGNHYMQHDNDFCVGCHVMGDAWTAFQRSEHRKLECHSCHRQSILVSAKQLVNWVAEKPQDIPKHAKVPTAVCSECHVRSVADSGWKRIIATAGHRLHLNSDSSALKEVACVTCHGQEVHRFKPVDKTCGQANCHASKDTKIVLGKMAGQTSQHCTGCHTFTRTVPENISMDSTRKYLVANGSQESCFGCHAMKQKLNGFDPQSDKGHNGVCGTCHNPHKQTEPKQAYQSCAAGGCHSDLASKSAFHAGLPAHTTASCGQCHKAHEWKAVGRECIDCHKGIFNGSPKAIPATVPSRRSTDDAPAAGASPEPAIDAASLRPIARRVSTERPRVARLRSHHVSRAAHRPSDAARAVVRVTRVRQTTPPPAMASQPPKDNPTFSHKIHRVLACTGCHNQKTSHGSVTVRTPAECAACHHAPDRSVSCAGCHDPRTKLGKTYLRTVTMRTSANSAPKTRELPFVHRAHRDLDCKGCHTQGIMLGVSRDCQSCHTDHHTAERACSTCHTPAKSVHQRAAHDGCAGSGCHTNATVLALPPSRSTCLVCHNDLANHKPKRECAECHAVTWGPTASKPR